MTDLEKRSRVFSINMFQRYSFLCDKVAADSVSVFFVE